MSTLTITTIQSKISWEDKAANLRMFEEKINAKIPDSRFVQKLPAGVEIQKL